MQIINETIKPEIKNIDELNRDLLLLTLEIANKCGDCLRLTSNHSKISDYAINILITDDGSSERLKIETLKSEIQLLAPDALKWRNLRNKIYNNRSLSFLLRARKKLSKFKNQYTLRRLE